MTSRSMCVPCLGRFVSSMKFENLLHSIGVFPKVNFLEEEFGRERVKRSLKKESAPDLVDSIS